jgi:hypothetical protein
MKLTEIYNQRQNGFWLKQLEQRYRELLDNYSAGELPPSGTDQLRDDAWKDMPKEFWSFFNGLDEDSQDDFNDKSVDMEQRIYQDVEFSDADDGNEEFM